ncbi:sorting nexin-21 [Anguilla anguilla]|uniref:sorting nexin-21 n=1 Tax=Anguilla anguilla TaxID=7936 RepID=UPI0015A951CF|nr:sorting nexin-21 [Anguilla anguilla]
MASKLLDRLRRSLFKEGASAEPGGAEEFPESSELEDDTECVSARLSGTLSFEGERTLDSEDTGEASGPDSDSDFLAESIENGSCSTEGSPVALPPGGVTLLTSQMRESWRSSQSRSIPVKLLFEVTDASVVQDGSSKYVLYTIHVIQSGMFDRSPALITRRYTDFERLHARLRRRHGDEMEGVCFPRKKLRRNFAAETIAKRSRAFEQYLSHLLSLAELCHSPTFLEFFYLGDLRAGQVLLRGGRYQEALGFFLNALRLQEKLGCQAQHQQRAHWLFTLLGLVACFQELDQLGEAQEHCDRALQDLAPSQHALQQQNLHPLLVPLLQANVRLSWKISKDKRRWEALLLEIQDSGVDTGNQPSLKEYLIKEVLEDSEGDPKLRVKGDST